MRTCLLAVLVALLAPNTIYALDLRPVPLSEDNQSRLGKLDYLSGWHMIFRDDDGGGISAIELRGDDFLAITDKGNWARGRIERKRDLITNIHFADFHPLLDLRGKALDGKKDEDAEGLSVFGRHTYISFERNHRIWRYDRLEGKASPVSFTLPGLDNLDDNDGIESLTHLADGRMLVLAEGGNKSGNALWIVSKDRQSASKRLYKPEDHFSPTAMATLPGNKGIALLERAYDPLRGPRVRIMWLSMADLNRNTGPLRGRELARLKRPVIVDNFEGISASPGRDGGIILDIVSDDNFNALQRSLWLRFRWMD